MSKKTQTQTQTNGKKVTLKNQEIFEAVRPMRALLTERIPMRISYKIAQLVVMLGDPLNIIEEARRGLIKKYAGENGSSPRQVTETIPKLDKGGKPVLDPDDKPVMEPNPNFDLFNEEWNELLAQEVNLRFEKVKLPEKVAATCDKCSHNMDRDFLIEPGTLVALFKFVEV